jgi:hypothetical protein
MAIYITNALYLSAIAMGGDPNLPLIGWQSVISQANISAAELPDAGYPISNIWSADTYTKWRSTNSGGSPTNLTILFYNPDLLAVDYIGIAGHNLGTIGAPFVFQYYDGAAWQDCGDGPRIADNDAPILDFFDGITALYFKLVITVAAGDTAQISHAKVGKVLKLSRPRYVGEIPGGMGKIVEKIGSKSYAGQHLGSVLISQGDKFNITQENIKPEFIRSQAMQDFFAHAYLLQKKSAGPVETFFYAWRPGEYPLEVQYCGETTKFDQPSNQRSNGMMQWSMSGDAFQ